MKNTNHIIALISDIRDEAHRFIMEELKTNGIKELVPSHGAILQVLYKSRENVTMQQLSNSIKKDKSTITALANKLEKLGYISKIKSDDDHRITYIILTEKGKELEPIFDEVSQKMLQKVYGRMDKKTKEEVVDALEIIRNNIKKS